MTQLFFPYAPERDIYRLLGVDPAASDEELMEAWRRLARTFHPDRNDSARSHEEMQVVNALRALLADPQARALYDRERVRWLASRMRSPGGERETAPASLPSGRRSSMERVAFAVGAGMRAFAVELAPARCPDCAAAVGRHDRRCGVCGSALAGRVG
jgi:curved DNA-binding protein CbpA